MATYKTDWSPVDTINFGDWNRIEDNILGLSNYLKNLQYPVPPLYENVSALSFDGVTSHVNLGDRPEFGISQNITMECWLYVNRLNTVTNNFFSKEGSYKLTIPIATGKLNALFATTDGWGVNTVESQSPVPLKKWFHVAVTYNYATGAVVLYQDGVVVGTATKTGLIVNSTNALLLGTRDVTAPAGYGLDGNMDDARIWNVVRSQAEIRDNMSKPLTGSETGLVGYWQCNEGSGTTLTATKGVNGTLVNGAGWTTNAPRIGNVVKNRTVKDVPYLSEINRIEGNLGSIQTAFGMTPPDVLASKTWTKGMGFSADDANRLENNVQIIMTYADLIVRSQRYSGAFTCGQEGGLY